MDSMIRNLFLCTVLVSACDAAGPVVGSPAKPKPVAADVPQAEPLPPLHYSYVPIGRRDPFTAFGGPAQPDKPLTETQRYELDQFRLIAVVHGGHAPTAMVVDPAGLGHTIRRNSLLGTNWGRVQGIAADHITVRESIVTWNGQRVVQDIELRLD